MNRHLPVLLYWNLLFLILCFSSAGCRDKDDDQQESKLEIVFQQPDKFYLGEIKEIEYTLSEKQPTSIEATNIPDGWTIEVLSEEKILRVTCTNSYWQGGKDGTAQIFLKASTGETSNTSLTLACKEISIFDNDVVAATEFGGGNGEQDLPYLISSPSHLKKLIDDTQGIAGATANDYNEKYFKLKTDFYISSDEWIPIGYFRGTFDGENHTIGGTLKSDSYRSFGFFGFIDFTSKVENLHIAADVLNGNINSEHQDTWTGAVAGNSSADIYNCSSSGTVTALGTSTGTVCVGGITGITYFGTIIECTAKGTVKSGNSSGNYSHVLTGGIVGKCASQPITIENCHNSAVIIGGSAKESLTGGIAGDNYGNILNCSNTGNVSGGNSEGFFMGVTITGGIVGSNADYMEDCINSGTVVGGTGSSVYTGGIAGLHKYVSAGGSRGGPNMHKCSNKGSISAANGYTGGIAGLCASMIHSCCTNSGTINGAAPSSSNPDNRVGWISGTYFPIVCDQH